MDEKDASSLGSRSTTNGRTFIIRRTSRLSGGTEAFEVADDYESGMKTQASDEMNSAASAASFVCEINPETGLWECRPYKIQILQDEIDVANDGKQGEGRSDGIVAKLRDFGVTVYIVLFDSPDLFADIERVVQVVSNYERTKSDNENQRCLLYRDEQGRVFNLTLKGYSAALASTWQGLLQSFSGVQALVAMMVLSRSFPCATSEEESGFKPAYLSLVLGLALTEEISFSWINTAMFVRGIPSISALTMSSRLTSDLLRKLVVLLLALAAAATGDVQKYLTLSGIGTACVVLAANLGSRAWVHLQWKPLEYDGTFAPIVAFVGAVFAGLIAPYMGHREIVAGGQAAMETVIKSSLVAAVIFVLSDFDEVQKFLVVGSETCNQDTVNLVVGIWWTLTVLLGIRLVIKVKPFEHHPDDEEPLLVEDQSSPVGYKVPNLPDFQVDPTLANRGHPFCTLKCEIVLGVLMALTVGAVIVFMAFTEIDDDITETDFDWTRE